MHTGENLSAPDEGSYLAGFLLGCVTVVLCLVLAYVLAAFSVRHLPVAIGYKVEGLTPLLVIAIPIAQVLIFLKRRKRKSAIGVIVSSVTIVGLCLLFVACLAGLVCHGSGRW